VAAADELEVRARVQRPGLGVTRVENAARGEVPRGRVLRGDVLPRAVRELLRRGLRQREVRGGEQPDKSRHQSNALHNGAWPIRWRFPPQGINIAYWLVRSRK